MNTKMRPDSGLLFRFIDNKFSVLLCEIQASNMGVDRVTTRCAGDAPTLAVLIAMMLVGTSVLVGWHFHVLVLIQILPSAVAMEYNTALCFVVMGASAWALVARHRGLLPAVGGTLIALFGTSVIFEHLSEVSLGIDTTFFWAADCFSGSSPSEAAFEH